MTHTTLLLFGIFCAILGALCYRDIQKTCAEYKKERLCSEIEQNNSKHKQLLKEREVMKEENKAIAEHYDYEALLSKYGN